MDVMLSQPAESSVLTASLERMRQFAAPPPQRKSIDPLHTSVGHLLTRAHSLPCSAAAQAFLQLVQPTSRFQLALDALLPRLDGSAELTQRILVSYILYSLYAPHPVAINPFKSALYLTFTKERDQAVKTAGSGGVGENEQLVWVLWKILKGDGNDIGPYSPSTLARSPLPPKLRASNLTLDEDTHKNDPYVDEPPSLLQFSASREGSGPIAQPRDNDRPASGSTTPNTSEVVYATPDEDQRNERVAHAMKLLLAARDRVLTLSEQRQLVPMIPQLTSTPMITSLDLGPTVQHNPSIAHPLFLSFLSAPYSSTKPHGLLRYLDVLKHLPPTLPSFDLLGRLLRDPTSVTDDATGGCTTVADLVRTEVLGWFVQESIRWLDEAEREEREGLISDDRFPKGVQNLCRFYTSLIKLGIVDPSSDAECTEMAHFTLRNARFEEANALYRVLVMGNF